MSHRLMTASRTSVIPGSFPGRDVGPRGPAPLSPKGAVEVVESEVGHSHAMLAIDGESSNNLEQLEELGREAIVADLELTEVHDEDTEKHPGVGELDLIVGVHAPGEMRKTHHVSAHSPFRRWQPHHVACLYTF